MTRFTNTVYGIDDKLINAVEFMSEREGGGGMWVTVTLLHSSVTWLHTPQPFKISITLLSLQFTTMTFIMVIKTMCVQIRTTLPVENLCQ